MASDADSVDKGALEVSIGRDLLTDVDHHHTAFVGELDVTVLDSPEVDATGELGEHELLDISEAVELAVLGLTEVVSGSGVSELGFGQLEVARSQTLGVHSGEVVAEGCAGGAGDSTSGALGAIVGVASDASFRGHVWPDELEAVELRRSLEETTNELGVETTRIANDIVLLENDLRVALLFQESSGGLAELGDAVEAEGSGLDRILGAGNFEDVSLPAVDEAVGHCAENVGKLCLSFGVRGFLESKSFFKEGGHAENSFEHTLNNFLNLF